MISYHVLPDGKTYAVILELIPYKLHELCVPCPTGYRALYQGETPEIGDLSFNFVEQEWVVLEKRDQLAIQWLREAPGLFSGSVWFMSTVRKL